MSDEKDLEDLREYAAELGIEVKHQWGVPKLTEEIEKAEAEAASTLPPAHEAPPETGNQMADMMAMMKAQQGQIAQLMAKNQELTNALGGGGEPRKAEDHSNEEKERLLKQATSLGLRVSDKWSSTQIAQAVAAAIEDVEDAAQARLEAYERSTDFVSAEVTEFGAGKISMGKHVGGAGDMKAPAGKVLKLDSQTAESLKERGFVSILGAWSDDGPE